MKIALVGASGYTGKRILAEALRRGHEVTAILRHPEKLDAHPALTIRQADLADGVDLTALLSGHQAIISAYNPGLPEGPQVTGKIVSAARQSGLRLLVVGGAGSLLTASGRRLVDEPDFPSAWKSGALATAAFLERLRAEERLDWCFISPAAQLPSGERTARYRMGRDELLTGDDGESRITVEDYAVAMIDELERPKHRNMRFCVAY